MKKADLNTLNGRFRQIRLEKRLTQEEFGVEVGLTRMGVNAIEIGRYKPTLDVVMLIHKRYNVPYSWLLDGDNKDVDADKLNKEISALKKILAEKEDLIETQKKLIKAIEK